MSENASQGICLTCGAAPGEHNDPAHTPIWSDSDEFLAEHVKVAHISAPVPQPVFFGEPNGQSRPLSAIAEEIQRDWKRPYFGAVPYLSAMAELDSVEGEYYEDSAASVVRYFLANAGTWRGETARRVKAELNAMVKGKF